MTMGRATLDMETPVKEMSRTDPFPPSYVSMRTPKSALRTSRFSKDTPDTHPVMPPLPRLPMLRTDTGHSTQDMGGAVRGRGSERTEKAAPGVPERTAFRRSAAQARYSSVGSYGCRVGCRTSGCMWWQGARAVCWGCVLT